MLEKYNLNEMTNYNKMINLKENDSAWCQVCEAGYMFMSSELCLKEEVEESLYVVWIVLLVSLEIMLLLTGFCIVNNCVNK